MWQAISWWPQASLATMESRRATGTSPEGGSADEDAVGGEGRCEGDSYGRRRQARWCLQTDAKVTLALAGVLSMGGRRRWRRLDAQVGVQALLRRWTRWSRAKTIDGEAVAGWLRRCGGMRRRSMVRREVAGGNVTKGDIGDRRVMDNVGGGGWRARHSWRGSAHGVDDGRSIVRSRRRTGRGGRW